MTAANQEARSSPPRGAIQNLQLTSHRSAQRTGEETKSHRVGGSPTTTLVMCQQFDPLVLMCLPASTLCPLTRLDVLSHRVFFFNASFPHVQLIHRLMIF